MDGGNSARKRQSGDSLLSWASSATFSGCVGEEMSVAAAPRSLMLLKRVVYQVSRNPYVSFHGTDS
jgi:hypothetical protein